MLGTYLHIPWCATRCIYCDFNTYVDGEDTLKARYHAAVRRELREGGAALSHPAAATIFFGGGTPTLVPPSWLVELVEEVRGAFLLHPDAEITVEANPGTVTVESLRVLRAGGVNRLSFGVQSLDDEELRFLSRLHDAEAARAAVRAARAAGFDNLSLDLIFNLPGQTLEGWQRNLRAALELEPEHLSLYGLIVEPGTPLQRQVAQGLVAEPDDDLAADQYEWTMEALDAAGFAQYEISNWARGEGAAHWETPRLGSAHNLIYWRNQPYLGVGAGAFGTVNGQRWGNLKRPQTYIQRVEAGAGLGPARDLKTAETIDTATARAEHMMLGLRLTREGVGATDFCARFGEELGAAFPDAIAGGIEKGLLEWVEAGQTRLRLTYSGRLLANAAIRPFLGGLT